MEDALQVRRDIIRRGRLKGQIPEGIVRELRRTPAAKGQNGHRSVHSEPRLQYMISILIMVLKNG